MICSFCGKEIPRGTGKIYVRKDSKVLYFHSNKCEYNALKLNRDPKNLKWTAHYVKGIVPKKKEEK